MPNTRRPHTRRGLGLRTALAVALTLPLIVGGLSGARRAEAGSPPLNWTYRDKNHKFSFLMFRDYKEVPQKVGSVTAVCKFRDPKNKGAARGTYDPAVEVVRIKLEGAEGPVVTGADGGPPDIEKLREALRDARRPKTVWDATVGRLWLDKAAKTSLEKIRKKPGKIQSKDKPKLPGKLWQFDVPVAGGRSRIHVTLAEYEKDGIAYGIFMTCGEPLKKSYAKNFKKLAKSFRWFDKKAKDVETLDVLEGVNITAKKRVQIEKGMVKGWDAIVSPKKNYIILYNTKNGKNHLLAKVIAKRIEMIREQIYEKQFPPAKPIDTVCIVRVCKDQSEYFGYGAPRGSAGYWSPMDEELVFYDASASKKPDDNTLAVLYHEAFHQYIFYSVGSVSPHSWFNEGHGDYYAGAKLKGKKFKIKPFQWRVGVVKGAIVQGPRAFTEETNDQGKTRKKWENRGYTPLQDLVHFTQREYYAYPGVSYAQGWSLIYFLREIVPKNKKYKAKWGHILDTYFDTLKGEVNGEPTPTGGAEEPEPPPPPQPTPPAPPAPPAPDDGGSPDDDGSSDEDDGDQDPENDPDEGDEEPAGPDFVPARPPPRRGGRSGALEKALAEAFKGIDWEEFEAAWLKGTKRGK